MVLRAYYSRLFTGITPNKFWRPYGFLGIEPGLVMRKARHLICCTISPAPGFYTSKGNIGGVEGGTKEKQKK